MRIIILIVISSFYLLGQELNHEMYPNKIQRSNIDCPKLPQTFLSQNTYTFLDSTSVVDSVVVTKGVGDIERQYYTYGVFGEMLSYTMEKFFISSSQQDFRLTKDYNENGETILELRQVLYDNHWVNETQITRDFNTFGKLDHELEEGWNDGKWENKKQVTNTYSDERIILGKGEKWITDDWVNDYQDTYTYNDTNNTSVQLHQYWNGTTWIDNWRITKEYDPHGYLLMDVDETWYTNHWDYNNRYSFEYDSYGNTTMLLNEEWDSNNNQWVLYWQDSYEYDENGNKIQYIWENGSGLGAKWTYSYDNEGLLIEELGESLLPGGTEIGYKRIYTYNSQKKLEYILSQRWNNDQWNDEDKETYNYNSDGHLVEGISETWDGGQWIPSSTILEFTDSYGRYYYYFDAMQILIYQSITTEINNDLAQRLEFKLNQNYPNPANPSTTISYSLPEQSFIKLKVYDLLGREVVNLVNKEQSSGSYSVQFDLSNLSSGIYIYQLKTRKIILSKKLLLLK